MTDDFGTLKSMTGFGFASVVVNKAKFEVEIQSVNRRHLEINLSLPESFFRFENEIRKLLGEKIARGQLNFRLRWKSENTSSKEITVDSIKIKALKSAWEQVALETGIKAPLTFDLFQDVLRYEEKVEGGEDCLKEVIALAIVSLDGVKRKEGEILKADFESRLKNLQEAFCKIEINSIGATDHYRQKLKDRLQELFSGHPENEERVLKEVALFAERIDITEEIVRFKMHMEAFYETLQKPLQSSLDSKGKRFEFLLQEMGREINTIGSKTHSKAIAAVVIDVKCDLEKMREQAQNIE